MSAVLLSPRESMQNAIGQKMRDFRQWCAPQGIRDLRQWKTRPLEASITVSKSKMIDSAEEMLRKLAETDNAAAIGDADNSGTSVYLPTMIIALAAIQPPPEYDAVIGRPDWLKAVIATDPLQRVVQMRCTPAAYRCQVAFFASNDHAAESISNQFCNFFRSPQKREFKVDYDLGNAGYAGLNVVFIGHISLGDDSCFLIGMQADTTICALIYHISLRDHCIKRGWW